MEPKIGNIVREIKKAVNLILKYQPHNLEIESLRNKLKSNNLKETLEDTTKTFNLFITIKLFISNSLEMLDQYGENKYGISFNLFQFIKTYLTNTNYQKETKEKYVELLNQFLFYYKNNSFKIDYQLYVFLNQIKEEIFFKEEVPTNTFIDFSTQNQNKQSLIHEILFLERRYECTKNKEGKRSYIIFDYFKALDADSLRKNSQIPYGSWLLKRNRDSFDYDAYFPLKKTYLNKNQMLSYKDQLKTEMDLLPCTDNEEKIQKIIKNRLIIIANPNLNYETVLKEYYAHFGMNPKEFGEYIQLKYRTQVLFPTSKTQSTQLSLYRRKEK